MSPDASFSQLVGIACHDLRTPLATVHGFARTLQRSPLGEPADRYVEMIDLASLQIAELLEELALVARIESGRYEPTSTRWTRSLWSRRPRQSCPRIPST